MEPSFWEQSIEGTIDGIDRGRYRVTIPGKGMRTCVAASIFRQDPLVLGDVVTLKDTGYLLRIAERRKRKNIFSRSNEKGKIKLIAANTDQLLIVTAATNPSPRPGLIDRLLIAAHAAQIQPILCITKTDLADPTVLAAHYADIPTVFSSFGKAPHLDSLLKGKKTLVIGHSGVGKSTLINELCPTASRAVGEVNSLTGKGKHTSSSLAFFPLGQDPNAGIIDTPGIRSFGIRHLGKAQIMEAVSALFPPAKHCPAACEHTNDAENCRLSEASKLSPERLQKLQGTLREAFSQEPYHTRQLPN